MEMTSKPSGQRRDPERQPSLVIWESRSGNPLGASPSPPPPPSPSPPPPPPPPPSVPLTISPETSPPPPPPPPVPLTHSSTSLATPTEDVTKTRSLSQLWQRMVRRLRSSLAFIVAGDQNDVWRQTLLVAMVINEFEVIRSAGVAFDSQCERDLVSSNFLRDNFEDFDLNHDLSAIEPIGTSITGRETYTSLGVVRLRWYGQKRRGRLSSTSPRYRPKYESGSFHVVDSDLFDIMIGSETIDRLGLFGPGRGFIAAFMGANSFDVKTTAEEQRKATERREKAQKDTAQREKEKKEEKKRDKQKSQKQGAGS